MSNELKVEDLYYSCDPDSLEYESSQEAPELDTIIGQDRAVRSLQFGLDINEKGFNIYLAGVHGTGRTTAVERYLNEYAARKKVPDDWCYVYNFSNPREPNALKLPPGKALEFQSDMAQTINTAINALRAAFKSDEYTTHKADLVNKYQQQKQEIFNKIGEKAQSEGFTIQPTPMGLLTIPTRAGRPISDQEFLQLSQEEKTEINKKQSILKSDLEEATRKAQNLDIELRNKLDQMNIEVARYAIKHHFNSLITKFKDIAEIPEHIDLVREDILENVQDFIKSEEEKPVPSPIRTQPTQTPLEKYAVNVLVENSQLKGAPVVLEMNPTLQNLIGKVEHELAFGALTTNFTLIRAGSLHRANGGFLVLPIEDVLLNHFGWDALKRALSNQVIVIEEIGDRLGYSTKSLQPEPIPLDIKIILLGEPIIYQMLLQLDKQFNELFKVKGDFDVQMPRTDRHISQYISFVCTLCMSENLLHLDRNALARIVEHASRISHDQEKLSTRFGDISDVIREASYYAKQENTGYVNAKHVEQAIEERLYRSSLINDRIQEMIARDQIKIDVVGEKVGQVNGLSVLNLGDISIGQPSRITASVSLGRDGVINIEREAEMSGPIHTKGVLILTGYLAGKFAQEKPLNLSAKLVFEQNYSGVEGDSASSTELYALLSAISGLPINQGIAVTGSVNQRGEVQVIGGVNEKIEGFFEVCRAKGLSGDQGVIIPRGNTANLMLKKPILEAVEDGKFHVWAISTISEGIEILTGVKAGERLENGLFEPDTVYERVDAQLNEFAKRMLEFRSEKE